MMFPTQPFHFDDFDIRPLDGPPPPSFDCGSEDQNRFFHERAWDDQQHRISTTYLYFIHGLLAGFATIAMSEVMLTQRERGWNIPYESIGAVKLLQLGVDRAFQGRSLGLTMVADVANLAREIGNRIGCRYVIVDARPHLVSWYELHGFKHNKRMQAFRIDRALQLGRDPAHLALSMRFDIRG